MAPIWVHRHEPCSSVVDSDKLFIWRSSHRKPKLRLIRKEVLGVTELLEAILLQLDMKTLLVSCSRVSKTWQLTIGHSLSLQRALFFRPIAPHPRGEVEDGEDRTAPMPLTINPLLVKHFGPHFFPQEFKDQMIHHSVLQAEKHFYMPWTSEIRAAFAEYCDIDGKRDIHFFKYSQSRAPRPSEQVSIQYAFFHRMMDLEAQFYPSFSAMSDEEIQAFAAAREPFTRAGASWRRMLVSHPDPPTPTPNLRLGLWEGPEGFSERLFPCPYCGFSFPRVMGADVGEARRVLGQSQHQDQGLSSYMGQGQGLRMGLFYDFEQQRESLWQARDPNGGNETFDMVFRSKESGLSAQAFSPDQHT